MTPEQWRRIELAVRLRMPVTIFGVSYVPAPESPPDTSWLKTEVIGVRDGRLCGVCDEPMSRFRRHWPWWRPREGRWTHLRCVRLIGRP